ncbi:MAG: Serine/threonine-protein phosphatase [candidate division TM6 bacterium GW2011_GWF2_38_10]|nr:MAG: Serine/threonine-protein phosphatase [candidate division TM6 bacterium GW2011_GWF2_38_10]
MIIGSKIFFNVFLRRMEVFMLSRLLLLALCFSNYAVFATLPQDSAQSVSSKSQDESISYASLTGWSAACLSSYDEQKAPKMYSYPSPVLSFEEFVRVFNEYKENMQEKGILNEATWNAIDQKTAILSDDVKHPHVTVLRIGNESKVCFIGDLHGSLHSLLRSLWRLVALGYLDDQFKIIKKDFYMVFTGDYVDRGRFSIEVLYTLLRLKCVNWEQVYLIRGNHEKIFLDMVEPRVIDFEIEKKYGYEQYEEINPLLYQLYDTMPLAVYIVVNDEVIKAVHGGFAPYSYYDVNHLKNNKEVPESLPSIRYIYIPLGSQGNFSDQYPENSYSGYQWCDFEIYKKPKSSKNLEFFKDSLSQDFIKKAGSRIWRVGRSASQLLLEKAGIRLMMRGHQHHSFGLKVLGISGDSDTFKPATGDWCRGNPSLYNWVAALSHIGAIDEHNESDGFLVSKMIPIFTFSSAIEGVGVKSDCFGILSIKGPFEEWRLKVYEFPVWFASTNPSISKLTNPFTLIKPINKTIQDKSYKSTSGMEDSIFVEFSEEQGDQATIKGWLQEIVNTSAGNNQ